MVLTYHRAASALIGLPLAPSVAGQTLVAEREAALGIRFPASVREWYGLAGAISMLSKYSNMDHPVPIAELGAPKRDWHGDPAQDFIAEGLLVFLDENQYVAQWAVRLDGTDDPAVVVRVLDSTAERGWRHCADHFSTFIQAQVWDWGTGFGNEDACTVQAQDRTLDPGDLALLRRRFAEGPRTHGWPGRINYRFSDRTFHPGPRCSVPGCGGAD